MFCEVIKKSLPTVLLNDYFSKVGKKEAHLVEIKERKIDNYAFGRKSFVNK